MQLSRRPSLPPHPHPQRGRGKKQGEGSAAGPGAASRSGAEGLRAEAAPGAGGGRPRGSGSPAQRTACAWKQPPQHGSRHLASVFCDQSSPCLGCDPRSSKSGEIRQLGVTAGLRSSPVLSPRAPAPHRPPGSAGRLGTGEREGRAGQGSCSSLPFSTFPRRRQSGGGGRGPSPGGVQGQRAGKLSRSPAGGRRGRAGVGGSGRAPPGRVRCTG